MASPLKGVRLMLTGLLFDSTLNLKYAQAACAEHLLGLGYEHDVIMAGQLGVDVLGWHIWQEERTMQQSSSWVLRLRYMVRQACIHQVPCSLIT